MDSFLHRPPRPPKPLTVRGTPSRYLTDGVHLYRFIGWVGRSVQATLAELEDCRSLDVVLVTREDLVASRLRPVRPVAA